MNKILQLLTKKHSSKVEEKAIIVLFSFIQNILIILHLVSIVVLILFFNDIFYIALGWYIASFILYSTYLLDYRKFLKHKNVNYEHLFKRFRNDSYLTGIVWAMLPIIFLPILPQDSQYMLIMLLICLAGGVSGFVFDFRISWILISSIMVPLILVILFSSIPNHIIMALIIFLFYMIIILSSFNTNKIFFDSLTNEELYRNSYKRLKMQTKKIRNLYIYDELTSLPNRRNYRHYMKKMIKNESHQEFFSLLFYIDLNHFKQINDTFGHIVGDKLLCEVASRLNSLIDNEQIHLSHLSGDEFIFIFPFVSNDRLKSNQEALKIAYSIKNIFAKVFSIDDINIHMRSSISIVLIEPRTETIENIMRQADMAMYQTKRAGQDNIYFYNQSLDFIRVEMVTLQNDLNDAIDNNQLKLFYQPIVNIVNDKLVAMEALLRWEHPQKGFVSPESFIPMATESGLIVKLSWWIIDNACQQLALWRDMDLINFKYIAVNVNQKQLHELNFIDKLEFSIKKYNIDPSLLKLEITETTLIENFIKTQKIIQDLKLIGIECNIDDFGTGYSSLSYLKQISFKTLKIDRIFIADMIENMEDEKLVKSIIEIAKQFNYDIVVEGVETLEQRNRLMNIDRDISYQGWLCSKALSACEFEDKFLLPQA